MCALHSELILHLFKYNLVVPLFLARVWVKSVSWNRAWVYLHACVGECVKFYLRYLLPPHFVFLREIFASLFYWLTLYNIVFTSFLPLFYDLLFVLTKPNWTFLLYFFFIRLEDCCCCLVFLFSLQRAMCTSDVTRRYLIERVCLCVYWWARVPALMRGGGACVCGSEVA